MDLFELRGRLMALISLISTLQFIWAHPIGSRRPVRCAADYFRWQLASRLGQGAAVVEWIGGARLVARRGMTGATGNVYVGLHEFEEMAFVLHVLRPGDLFVDIGANVGSYTILAAKVAGARVAAIEPHPTSFAALGDNVRLNDVAERVTLVRAAITAQRGTASLSSGLDTMNHVIRDGSPAVASLDVPAQSLDDVLQGEQPSVVKIDVEGFETEVVAGGHRTLEQDGLLAVVMELNRSGDRYGFDETRLHEQMLSFGFALYDYAPFERRLLPREWNYRARGNGLYVRASRVELVEGRLRAAPALNVKGIAV